MSEAAYQETEPEVTESEWAELDSVVAALEETNEQREEKLTRRAEIWADLLARGVQRRTIAQRSNVSDRAVSAAVERLHAG